MPDRENLTALLKDAETAYDKFIHETSVMPNKAAFFAEYLIDHGVTFATDNNVGDKWIPVTERLPGKMEQCVCRYVFGENTDYPFFQVLWYFANLENPHFQNEGSMGLTVTHWMPLPEPPKEGE